jgi:IS1 family transposase
MNVERVYCKKTPCWLWHAIDHDAGDIVVYVFGTRESEMLEALGALLNGLNLNVVGVFFDDDFAYHGVIPWIFCVRVSGMRSVFGVSI